MSKWVQNFQQHAFQGVWRDLKQQASESKVDDISVTTSVSELSRLRKVIKYIDELLANIDPDLVPINTWDNFHTQAVAARDQVSSYNVNKNIGHITNANGNVDNLLTYVRPYMVIPKGAASAITKSVKENLSNIEDYWDDLQNNLDKKAKGLFEIHNQASSSLDSINESKDRITDFDDELFKHEGIKNSILNTKEESESSFNSIQEYYDDLLKGNEEKRPIKAKISETSDSIEELHNDSVTAYKKILDELKTISEFHEKVEGELNDEGEREGGLKKKLEKLFADLKLFDRKQKEKLKALNDEVESLLPGATSAGLSYKYRALRRYFSKPAKSNTYLFYWAIGILFTVSLITSVKDIGLWYINFVDLGDYKLLLKNTVYKLPILLPVLWLAFFASKRRSEFQRLQQEYAHKEAIAASYQSFKKQIEQLNDENEELKKQLLSVAIESMQYNASVTLDGKHGDKMPVQEVIDSAIKSAVKSLDNKK